MGEGIRIHDSAYHRERRLGAFRGAASLYNQLVSVMNGIGTIGIAFLMGLICFDVFMRAVASQPVAGVPEIVRLSIVAIVFLQAAHTLAVGRFTVSEVFLDFVDKRSVAAGRTLRSVYSLAGAALFACVFLGSLDQLDRAWESDDFIGAQGIFTLPVWPTKAIVVFGSAMLTIQFVVNAWRYWHGDMVQYDEAADEVKRAEESL